MGQWRGKGFLRPGSKVRSREGGVDGAKKQEVGRGVRSPRGRPGGQPLPREHYKNLNCTSRAGPLSSERVWNGGVFLWGCLEGLPLIFLRTGLLLLPVLSPGEEQTRRKGDVGASKKCFCFHFPIAPGREGKANGFCANGITFSSPKRRELFFLSLGRTLASSGGLAKEQQDN